MLGINASSLVYHQILEANNGPQADPTYAAGGTPAPAPTASSDLSSILHGLNQQFSKEIEDEANSYFQRIYNHPPHPTFSIDEVLDMLKRFKDSAIKKEKVI
jgi:hypothetical protein